MKFLRCGLHTFHEALGVDSDTIRVFWALEGTNSDQERQTAYRLTVAPRSENHLLQGQGIVWDSGKIQGDAQRNVLIAPEGGFASTTFHYWRVSVWNENDEVFHSPVQELFTSYPRCSRLLPPYSMNQTYMPHTSLIFKAWFEDEKNRWKGVWIGDNGDKPLYMRHSYRLEKKPSRAIVFASGLGHFNMYCNGQPISDHVLSPGWTDYHRRVQFVAFDASDKLQVGDNVLAAHVGNGFYAGDQGEDRFFWPTYEDNTFVRYGNELCFFAEVHLLYDDGTTDCLITGPEWTIRKSATTLANIYMSETKDLRRYPTGWTSPGFVEDGEWEKATPVTGPRGKLSYQSQPPVKLHETFAPITTKKLKPRVVSFDLGQNASIMPKLELTGPAGAVVLVRFSETVDEDGHVLMPDPLFKQFETGVFCKIILSGSSERETWESDFSFTSARYIQVEGVAIDDSDEQHLPRVHSVVGRHVSSAARRLGYVKTDKEDVNQLINACYWSLASNLFSYHTDCPQMEKFAWLEVTHLLAPVTQYMRDMESLYTKILDDMIDAQESDGLIPTMAPEMRYMCGPLHDTITWGGALVLLPEMLKRFYGSTAAFEKVFNPCVRYMEYIQTKERQGGLIEHGLGDWGIDIAFGNHQANIETAIYYKCLRNIELMAKDLGYAAQEQRFKAWADRIYNVYNEHLLVNSKTDRPYAYYTSLDEPGTRDCTMVAQAFALQFQLVPAEHVVDVQKAFVEACAGGRIRAGEIGLKFLWNTLADVDRPDIVLTMARQEEHPSYMRFLRRGETTLNEFWQDACRSKCHDMLATIHEWFYEAVLGLRIESEAYKVWTVKPPLASEFDHVEGVVDCPYGEIKIVFDRKCRDASSGGEDVVEMQITVPTGTTGVLLLPSETSRVHVSRLSASPVAKSTAQGSRIPLLPGRYTLELHP
ncbi:hypothetical protein ACHAQA_007835 [Verticillium albo-atrum]